MASPVNVAVLTAFFLLITLFRPLVGENSFKPYSFSQFNQTHRTQFDFLNNSTISQGALQITPDTSNPNYRIENESGRVLLKDKFKLFDVGAAGSTKLASFYTSFLFNIYHRPNTSGIGEGLAFIVAPDSTNIPENSEGQYIGLTNATTDGNSANSFLAVEFDTVKQDFDPDDNHVGININSIRSKKTFSLSSIGIQLSPLNATKYLAWIDYNGSTQILSVYLANEGKPKPSMSILNYSVDTSKILRQDSSYFGFAASTGNFAQLNCILAWNLTVELLPTKKDAGLVVVRIVVPAVIAVVVLGSAVAWFVWYRRRRSMADQDILGALKSLPGTPSELAFADLKKATNNFDERQKLGQGGFGVVYKGTLPKEGKVVAVKKFSRESMKGIGDFLAELAIINRLRHKNLVKLIGWCHRKGTLLIVYDFMPKGSLDEHLFKPNGLVLSWERRYNIVSGIASALHYLHNEYDHKVVHRDIKASNVMLDSDFNARLGDFGLARVLDDEKTSYVEAAEGGVQGTVGYIAPECFHTGKATRESDVYSFGAVILEIVSGRRPRSTDTGSLVDYVWTLYREGRILEAVDEKMEENFDQQDAVRLLLLGLGCSHPNPRDRPKTELVVQVISRSVEPPRVPPFRPPFIWHMGMGNESSSSTDVTSSTTGVSVNWTPLSISTESPLKIHQ